MWGCENWQRTQGHWPGWPWPPWCPAWTWRLGEDTHFIIMSLVTNCNTDSTHPHGSSLCHKLPVWAPGPDWVLLSSPLTTGLMTMMSVTRAFQCPVSTHGQLVFKWVISSRPGITLRCSQSREQSRIQTGHPEYWDHYQARIIKMGYTG